jgi:hypothetical protein
MNHDNGITEPEDLVRRLERERPVPAPSFRGELRRRLLASAAEGRLAPAGIRRLVIAYAGSGAMLILIATAGLAGVGPFAA